MPLIPKEPSNETKCDVNLNVHTMMILTWFTQSISDWKVQWVQLVRRKPSTFSWVLVLRRLGVKSKKRIICKPDTQKALPHIKISTVYLWGCCYSIEDSVSLLYIFIKQYVYNSSSSINHQCGSSMFFHYACGCVYKNCQEMN